MTLVGSGRLAELSTSSVRWTSHSSSSSLDRSEVSEPHRRTPQLIEADPGLEVIVETTAPAAYAGRILQARPPAA